jgi:hypothetical protein
MSWSSIILEMNRIDSSSRKHGTFRPKLLQLVSSNSANEIKELTKSVFAAYDSSNSPDRPSLVNKLAKLKGIGPATASLILAVYDPDGAIFFGDEVFRWMSWNEPLKGGKGWGRRITYSLPEYRQLDGFVSQLISRLGVKAVEVEMVGYVLGKEGTDLDSESKREAVQDSTEKKAATPGTKRKQTQELEGKGRRSKRLAGTPS